MDIVSSADLNNLYAVIGLVVVTFGVAGLGAFWKFAQWMARVDYDLDNFGKMLGTEKSRGKNERTNKSTAKRGG